MQAAPAIANRSPFSVLRPMRMLPQPITTAPTTLSTTAHVMWRDSRSVPVSLPSSATHSGAVETRTTLLLIDVKSSEVIHVAK